MKRLAGILLIGSVRILFAQSSTPKEALGIIEVGAAPSWSLTNSGATLSPTIAIEFTPIENWLELEIGTTPTFSRHSTEWTTDILFKKPWTLSQKVEFMFGVGPEWIHSRSGGARKNFLGGEVALDFMFWPSSKRRFGWYLEPAFERAFGANQEKSISISGGLLISIR